MVYNSHSSKRRKETALKRGKRQRVSNGASPVTTCDDESNSTGELGNANQISVGVSVDADHLGPCEPGTDVVLEGIVWAETNRGVLVVNVTWKGRTYVGTLLDSSSGNFNMYRSIAPFFDDVSADKGGKEASKRVNAEVATTCTDANGSHCDACDLSQPSSAPMCFRQLCACVTQCKSPLQHESSNAIQRLEYMTSNRINALQTQSTQAKSCDNLACAQVEQSPINALSSLIEDTSKSFEIHNRHQTRCGGQKSASWPMDHNSGEWKQRRRDTIRAGDVPFAALDQRGRHATSECTRSNVIIGELCEAVGMPFAGNNTANRAPKSH